MLAALQGRASSPSHINPYSGLHSPIGSRCGHVKSCIASLPLKELHEFFPYLLSNIFGFDGTPGWQLKAFNWQLHADFQQLFQMLSPTGELFQLISRLESAHYLYEFPISCLPRPSQQSLMEGVLPPLYSEQIARCSPTQVQLTPFEYYFFHFAHYLIFNQTRMQSPLPSTAVCDSLYTHLLESYLHHYLPLVGTLPPAISTPQRQGSPHHHGNTTPADFSYTPFTHHHFTPDTAHIPHTPHTPHRSTIGLLRANGEGEFNRVAMVTKANPQDAPPLLQAEVVVQVLVEFWLNQNTYDDRHGDIITHAQNQFVPNEEHLLLVRRLVKHAHYFSNGNSFSSSETTLIPVTEGFRRNLIPSLIQKQLFYFLRYSFRHSPLDNNFRYILELWLTYLQSWRYTDPQKTSAENKESFESVPRKWRGFVLDNFAFFSSLLVELIGRGFQLDLTNEMGATLLYRVTKVFSQPGLMDFVEYGESLLLNPDTTVCTGPRLSPSIDACSLRALFVDLDGPMFKYQPLFDSDTLETIQSLLGKIRSAKGSLMQRTSPPHPHHSPLTHPLPPPPPTPLTPTHPSQPLTAKRSWWSAITDIFSEGSTPLLSPPPTLTPHILTPSHTDNTLKIISLLDSMELNLCSMFRLAPPPPPLLPPPPPSGDGAPLSPPSFSHSSVSPLNLTTPPDHTHFPVHQSFAQGTIKSSAHTFPQKKIQLMQGLNENSSINVRYRGDPILQPIRSFENRTLVRSLHRLSVELNNRFSSQLQSLGASESMFSHLLKKILSPPPPPPFPTDAEKSVLPRTPKNRVSKLILPPAPSSSSSDFYRWTTPRINLRFLASYYTIVFFLLVVLFVSFLFVSLWPIFAVLFLFILLFCLSGCAKSSNNLKEE